MIIALAGRKKSGKSELAKIAELNGFQRISFAEPLKELVSLMIGESVDFINKNKTKIIDFAFSEENSLLLSRFSGLPKEEIYSLVEGKSCETIRNMLQFIGSDVIRRIDPDWHINKVKSKLKDGFDYCFDDLRFPNEKAFLDNERCLSFFIIRQRESDYDNHESEISLRWCDFDDFVINNCKDIAALKKRFTKFIKNIKIETIPRRITNKTGARNRLELREWFKKKLLSNSSEKIAAELGRSVATVNGWIYKLLIYQTRELYPANERAFLDINQETAYLAGVITADGCVRGTKTDTSFYLTLSMCDKEPVERLIDLLETKRPMRIAVHKISNKNIYNATTNNPFVLENLKLWNIKPNKTQCEEAPFAILGNEGMIKAWIVGLIDGDGCICFGMDKKKDTVVYFKICVICSEEVKNFLVNTIPIKSSITKHKNGLNYYVNFLNHYALDFYNWLGKPKYGLTRKWDKVSQYLELNTKRTTPKSIFSD